MSLEIFPRAFGVNFMPQADFSYPNRTVTNRGDPPAQLDAVDLSPKRINHETRFEVNPETNKVVVKVVDKDTNEIVRKISDKGVEVISDAMETYTGKAFHELTA